VELSCTAAARISPSRSRMLRPEAVRGAPAGWLTSQS